jgi:hypothetical protein
VRRDDKGACSLHVRQFKGENLLQVVENIAIERIGTVQESLSSETLQKLIVFIFYFKNRSYHSTNVEVVILITLSCFEETS